MLPLGVIPVDDNHTLAVAAKGGRATIISLDSWDLRSIWRLRQGADFHYERIEGFHYCMQYLGVIDGTSKPDPAEFAIYGGGLQPLTDSDKAIPLDVLLQRLDEASALVTAAPQAMPAGEVFDAEKGTTLNDRLQFYMMVHESLHAGQLEILYELALAGK